MWKRQVLLDIFCYFGVMPTVLSVQLQNIPNILRKTDVGRE